MNIGDDEMSLPDFDELAGFGDITHVRELIKCVGILGGVSNNSLKDTLIQDVALSTNQPKIANRELSLTHI